MLEFTLDYIRDGIAPYSFHPEGDGSFTGHVRVDIESYEPVEIVRSGHPYEFDNYSYAGKLLARTREFAKTGDFKKSGIIAWC